VLRLVISESHILCVVKFVVIAALRDKPPNPPNRTLCDETVTNLCFDRLGVMSLNVTAAENSGAAPAIQSAMAAVPSPSGDQMDISPARDAAPSEAPQSQPMTATASNSSELPATDNGDLGAAVPYGTRSRNRTSGVRPNYADDKDIDLEIEAAAKLSKNGKKATASTTAAISSNMAVDSNPDGSGGFATINAGAQLVNGVNGMGPAPSTGSAGSGNYNLVPPPQASKKRKQPGSNTTVPAVTTIANTSITRTKSAAPPNSRAYVETNMLSFQRCGARLNSKKQLVADDGTSLQANGKPQLLTI
jgi:hypothetical protein